MPQFKKLTDCPENLREAIDWLIHVRHSGDKKGLDKLANALKRFIEGAITKTYTSIIDKYAKLLDTSWQRHECCDTKFQAIKQIQEQLKNHPKFVYDSLNGPLSKLKYDRFVCEKKHYIDSSKDTALMDVDAKLEKLKEHSRNLYDLTNNPTLLLTNLCIGLEKFLGFNSDSKGYDGTGIVYSDLDRLCDAVMAFLYQVLKDVSEKQPYKVGKTQLIGATKDIRNEFWNGHKGLKRVMDKLPGRLSSYYTNVKAYNDKLKEPIIRFRREMKSVANRDFDSMFPEKNFGDPQYVEQAERLMKECKKYTQMFNEDLDLNNPKKKIREAIEDLNSSLSEKVGKALNVVMHEIDRLNELSVKEYRDMKNMESSIKLTLDGVKDSLNVKIEKDVADLVRQMKAMVSIILDKLKDIYSKLKQYVESLGQFIFAAEKCINEALEKVEIILNEVNVGASEKKPNEIIRAISDIQFQAQLLLQAGEEAKKDVKQYAAVALQNVLELDRVVRMGLQNVKNGIETQLHAYVKKNLLENIKNRLGEIIKGTGGDGKGLKEIEKEAKTYAMKFTRQGTDGFDSIVEKWICDIWGKNKNVMQKVKTWVEKNEDVKREYPNLGEQINTALTTKIAQKIVENLTVDIQEAVKVGKESIEGLGDESDPETIIGTYVTAIQTVCDEFAKKLENKEHTHGGVPGNGLSKLAGEIFGMIEREVVRISASTNKDDLELAIQYTIQQLVPMARTTGEQIRALVVDCHLSNIKTALGVAEGLQSDLEKSTEGIGSGVDLEVISPDHPFDITKKVEGRIRGILEKVVGTDDKYGKLNRVPDEHFARYDELIKQDKVPSIMGEKTLTGDKDAQEGKLPLAIGEIRDIVTNTLTGIDEHKREADQKLGEVNEKLKMLCSDIKAQADGQKGLKKILTEFKTKHLKGVADNQLAKIHSQLSDLHGDQVRKALKAAENFVTHVDAECKKTVDLLKEHVDTQLQDAKYTLTSETRKHYVTTMKLLLKRYAEKVTEELTGLPAAIDEDLTVGFKGLLKTMNDHKSHLVDLQTLLTPHGPVAADNFKNVAQIFKDYLDKIFTYVKYRAMTPVSPSTESHTLEPNEQSIKAGEIQKQLSTLLAELIESNHFDHTFSDNLNVIIQQLGAFSTSTFSNIFNPALLDALKSGVGGLVHELRKAYVNNYSGREWDDTIEYEHCAKIFCTITPLLTDLMTINEMCMSSDLCKKFIFKEDENYSLARFLENNGYDIPSSTETEDGELRCGLTGMIIGTLLTQDSFFKYLGKHDGRILHLYNNINQYYEVCHLLESSSTKHPSSVHEMLTWLAGLPHNSVYGELSFDGFASLFGRLDEVDVEIDGDVISGTYLNGQSLEAFPNSISAADLSDTLTDVCHQSETVLVSILGHGHAGGRYAVDDSNNSLNLHYPTDMNNLLCSLFDILKRLHYQLYFLYRQCSYGAEFSGWADCWYGKGVGGSAWNCNRMQCPNRECDQNVSQNCGKHPMCGLKSPLQSFLEDGLTGFLPHRVSSDGTKISCSTCLKTPPGMPCKTPVGFAEIGIMASHTRTGEHLERVLHDFCGQADKPLSRLCSYFICVLHMTPRTLSDIFAFYFKFIDDWDAVYQRRQKHRENAYDKAVINANFKNQATKLDITALLGSKRHTASSHADGALYSLVECNSTSTFGHYCGPYLIPLCLDICGRFTEKHADRYLSWILYLTDTFYDLLKKMYDECNKCGRPGSRCYNRMCSKTCKMLQTHPLPRDAKHDMACTSIVQCPFTSSALYNYGFALYRPSNLNGALNDYEKRTCGDFCRAFENVLKEGKLLHTLAFVTIPDFIFRIRAPFFYTTVALWSLSLLYLFYVLLGRLDTLHIRSHLRSPASYKIAAQSLLAAARVGKLAKISYLQA